MKVRILNILKYGLFLGLGVFLVWWSLNQIPDDKWNDFKAAFATANYWLFVPVFIILTLSHLLRAWRWKMLMEPLGYNPTLRNTFFAVMVGYLANLAIPRLGEVLRCTILAKYEHIPADKLVGTIVAERAFDLLSLLLVFILAFIFQYDIIGEYAISFIKQLFTGRQGGFTPVNILVGLTIIGLVIFFIRLIFKNFGHNKFIGIIKKLFIGIGQGLLSARNIENKGMFFISSAGIWLMYLLGTWIGFYATVGTTGLGIEVGLSALAFASIGMIITPGGIGAYAILLAEVLALNGIAIELGLANGTLQWFAQLIIVLILGFISLGLLPYFNKKKKHSAKY